MSASVVSWPGAAAGAARSGSACCWSGPGLPRHRRATLATGCSPTCATPRGRPDCWPRGTRRRRPGPSRCSLRPLVADLARRLERLLGGSASVAQAAAAGRDRLPDVDRFRAEQVVWGGLGRSPGWRSGGLLLARSAAPVVRPPSSSSVCWHGRRRRGARPVAEPPRPPAARAADARRVPDDRRAARARRRGRGGRRRRPRARLPALAAASCPPSSARCLADARAGAALPDRPAGARRPDRAAEPGAVRRRHGRRRRARHARWPRCCGPRRRTSARAGGGR